MQQRIYLDGQETPFLLEDTGRLYNEHTKRWLKGGVNKGYHFYSLYFMGKSYIAYTHRYVAQYFVPNPDNLPYVHHIDGNKLNNECSNLQWVSVQEHNKIHIGTRGALPRIKIQLDDYNKDELAQFRNSPYYATKDGQIINTQKQILMRFEKSGNYYRFTGYYNLGKKHFLVHRAIWEAFNGPIPEGYDIDHIDSDPHNNRLENLQAITHLENIKKRDIDFSYVADNFYRGK